MLLGRTVVDRYMHRVLVLFMHITNQLGYYVRLLVVHHNRKIWPVMIIESSGGQKSTPLWTSQIFRQVQSPWNEWGGYIKIEVRDQREVNLERLIEADRYFDQTKKQENWKQRKGPKQQRETMQENKKTTNSKIMHLLASLHAPSQNQARHHIWEKPRRQTMEKRYKTTTSSIYQAASAVYHHHGEHCRKRRMERNNEHPVAGKED